MGLYKNRSQTYTNFLIGGILYLEEFFFWIILGFLDGILNSQVIYEVGIIYYYPNCHLILHGLRPEYNQDEEPFIT
jgi:hypothetical protein